MSEIQYFQMRTRDPEQIQRAHYSLKHRSPKSWTLFVTFCVIQMILMGLMQAVAKAK